MSIAHTGKKLSKEHKENLSIAGMGRVVSKETREKICIAIKDKKPFKEVILNYRKNGEMYYCEIEAHPKFDKDGNFLNYIAFEQAA